MLSNVGVAGAPLMWGTTYVISTELLPDGRPLLTATVRALVAGVLVLAFVRQPVPQGWWGRVALLGVLNIGAFFALLFVAADHLPGGVAAVLTSTQPLLVLVLGRWLLQSRVTTRQVAAVSAAAVGVAVLVLRATATIDTVGTLAALGAAACSALGLVLTRRWQPPLTLWALTGWQLAAGGVVLLPLLFTLEGLPDGISGGALLGYVWLVGPSTVGGYLLWFGGIRTLPAPAVAALGLLSPVTAATLGWVVLGQSLTAVQLGGGAVALLAVVVLQRPPAAQQPPPATRQRVRAETVGSRQ